MFVGGRVREYDTLIRAGGIRGADRAEREERLNTEREEREKDKKQEPKVEIKR